MTSNKLRLKLRSVGARESYIFILQRLMSGRKPRALSASLLFRGEEAGRCAGSEKTKHAVKTLGRSYLRRLSLKYRITAKIPPATMRRCTIT